MLFLLQRLLIMMFVRLYVIKIEQLCTTLSLPYNCDASKSRLVYYANICKKVTYGNRAEKFVITAQDTDNKQLTA